MAKRVSQKGYISSGEQTGDIAIKASKGELGGFMLYGAGDDMTIVLYDDPDSANGTVLAKSYLDKDLEGRSKFVGFPEPIHFSLGCWADVTVGVGASYEVYYR